MVIAHNYVLTPLTEAQMGLNMQVQSKYTEFVIDWPVSQLTHQAMTTQT